jgi:histidinol-phosphate aminotransferase
MSSIEQEFLLPHIARMTGYIPGEQPKGQKFVKLNTNENPYPPSSLVLERLKAACDGDLRLYPDAAASEVCRRLAEQFAVPAQQILVGNGSDELLNTAMRCFVGTGDRVVFPTPTYPYYAKLVELQNATAVTVDFDESFALPGDALTTAAGKLTLVANPNSPSGTLASTDELAALAAAVPGLLLIDEAYVDFSDGGCIELVETYPNLIVVRTMSKSFSLAGMRIGFCFASPEVTAAMRKVKEHYNIGSLSQVAAAAALDDVQTMHANARRVCQTRSRLSEALGELGFHVWPSAGNFVLARVPDGRAAQLYAMLRDRGVLVRYFEVPRLRDCLRISVGTEEEIDILLRELDRCIGRGRAR